MYSIVSAATNVERRAEDGLSLLLFIILLKLLTIEAK
jgi:hypothetical protein